MGGSILHGTPGLSEEQPLKTSRAGPSRHDRERARHRSQCLVEQDQQHGRARSGSGPAGLETALAVNRWRLGFRRVRRHLRTGPRLGLPFFGDKLDPAGPSSDHFPVAVHALAWCEDKAMTLRMFAPQALGLRDGLVVGHGRSIARSHVEAQRPWGRGGAERRVRRIRAAARTAPRVRRRVDGRPWTIELAASRCGLLSPDEIAPRLHDALGALGSGGRCSLTTRLHQRRTHAPNDQKLLALPARSRRFCRRCVRAAARCR